MELWGGQVGLVKNPKKVLLGNFCSSHETCCKDALFRGVMKRAACCQPKKGSRRPDSSFLLVDVDRWHWVHKKYRFLKLILFLFFKILTFWVIQEVMKNAVNVDHCTFLNQRWWSTSLTLHFYSWSTVDVSTSILQPFSSRPYLDIFACQNDNLSLGYQVSQFYWQRLINTNNVKSSEWIKSVKYQKNLC